MFYLLSFFFLQDLLREDALAAQEREIIECLEKEEEEKKSRQGNGQRMQGGIKSRNSSLDKCKGNWIKTRLHTKLWQFNFCNDNDARSLKFQIRQK